MKAIIISLILIAATCALGVTLSHREPYAQPAFSWRSLPPQTPGLYVVASLSGCAASVRLALVDRDARGFLSVRGVNVYDLKCVWSGPIRTADCPNEKGITE